MTRLIGTILLVDWPSREVPDSLARAGLKVYAQDGPAVYHEYVSQRGRVAVRKADAPAHANIVYAFRPLDELPDIVALARRVGASTVWLQSGRTPSGDRDPRGCWRPPDEASRARSLVEAAGFEYVDSPYIVDALGSRAGQ